MLQGRAKRVRFWWKERSASGAIPKATRTTTSSETEAATRQAGNQPHQVSLASMQTTESSPEQRTTTITHQLIDLEELEDRRERHNQQDLRRNTNSDKIQRQRFDHLPRLNHQNWNSLEQRISAAALYDVNSITDRVITQGTSFENYPPSPYAAPSEAQASRRQQENERMRNELITQ